VPRLRGVPYNPPRAMRPHKPTSRSRRAADRAVQKRLQWGLGWLRGYPAEPLGRGRLRWVSVPRPGRGLLPESIVLDGGTLSRATRNRNRLLTDFPRALPRVVGDVEHWKRWTAERLEAVKALVNHGGALPGALELFGDRWLDRRLARWITPGAALEVVVARLWWLYGEDEERARALGLLAESAEAATAMLANLPGEDGRDALLSLCELAVAGGGEPVVSLLRFLADRRAHETSLVVERWCERDSRRTSGPTWLPRGVRWPVDSTTARPARCLCSALPRVVALEDAPRADLLPVLEALLPDRSFEAWARWWDDVCRWSEALESRVDDGEPGGDPPPLPEEAVGLTRQQPPTFALGSAVTELLMAATGPTSRRAWLREAGAGLPRLPELFDGSVVRLGLVEHWLFLHRFSEERKQAALLEEIVRRTLDHLADPVGHPARYRYWRRVMLRAGEEPRHWGCLDGDLLDDRLAPATPAATFEALAAMAERDDPEDDEGWQPSDLLDRLLPAVPDGETAVRWACDLHGAGLAYEVIMGCRHRLHLAFALARGSPEGVFAMLGATSERSFEQEDVRRASELLADEGFGHLCERAAEARPRELLRIIETLLRIERRKPGDGRRLVAEHSAASSQRPPAEDVRWCEAFPEELRPHLVEFQAVTPRAEAICARVLGRLRPDRESLETEIEHLRRRLADGTAKRPEHLRIRLEHLEARLSSGESAGKSPSGRTVEKLRERIERERVVSLRARLDERYRRLVTELCEEGGPHALPEDPTLRSVFDHVLDLPPRFRGLGLRLFRRRAGPPPWDLRDDPVNHDWVERARARGLRPEHWLDGGEPSLVKSRSGRWLRLALERDPLEVLRMGGYFQTCLSPGAENFYSAVLNAADSNKQVLYARDERGHVHGRCLLAVTRENGLLAFEPYHHDTAPDFPAMAGAFVEQLAESLGAELSLRGEVEDLHRGDWYDDGPEDVTGRFAFLEEDSEFMRQLPRLDPAELLPRLAELSGQDPPPIGMLRMLLETKPFQRRPELVLPLVGILEEQQHHPAESRCRIANMLRRAGEPESARRWLAPLVESIHGRRGLANHWDALAAELLESGNPCAALNVLGRSSRRRAMGEDDPSRWNWRWSFHAGHAHELLGRDRQALEAYSRAEELGSSRGYSCSGDELRDLRARISALRERSSGD